MNRGTTTPFIPHPVHPVDTVDMVTRTIWTRRLALTVANIGNNHNCDSQSLPSIAVKNHQPLASYPPAQPHTHARSRAEMQVGEAPNRLHQPEWVGHSQEKQTVIRRADRMVAITDAGSAPPDRDHWHRMPHRAHGSHKPRCRNRARTAAELHVLCSDSVVAGRD